MKEFVVKWRIEVDADSHEDAARKARQLQLDPESKATEFEVYIAGYESVYTDTADEPSEEKRNEYL